MASPPHSAVSPGTRAPSRARRLLACSVLLAVAVIAPPASAAPAGKEAAKRAFDRGRALYGRGSYAEALVEFQRAREAFFLPEFDYNIGQCYLKLDLPGEAAEAFSRFLLAKPDDPEAPSLRLLVVELGRRAKRAPDSSIPSRRAPLRGLRVGGLVLAGAGVVLAGTGLAFGLLAKNAGDDLTALDRAGRPFEPSLQEAGKRYEWMEIAFVAAGAAAAVTGLVLFSVGERGRSGRARAVATVVPVWTGSGGGFSMVGMF